MTGPNDVLTAAPAMRAVNALTQAVCRGGPATELFELTVDSLLAGTSADRASILLYDPDGVMRFKAWRGLPDAYRQAVEGHSPWTRHTIDPDPLVVPDVATHPATADYLPVFRQHGIGALAFIPLYCGELLGKFMLYYAEPHAFDDAELDLAGVVADVLAFAVHREQAEAKLVAANARLEDALARAREADGRKDEFLAVLGHELRNPLAPIVTALRVMALKGGAELSDERELIERQVVYLRRLVDDLLDIARIASGKLTLARAPIELGRVVTQAVELVSPLLDERGHHLSVQVGQTGLSVCADATRLTQIVVNLLTNAARYTDRGGHISISASREERRVTLTVRDDGIGISREALPHVFEEFVQSARHLDQSRGGLGLGLTIVRRLMELHGGEVWATSDGAGQGSTFSIRMPLWAEPPPALAPQGEQQGASAPGRRVLVVDDNVDAAMILSHALALSGHEPTVANDGPAALDAAARTTFDVGVLDLGLPVMDGLELARRLRGEHREFPLIAVTGYGQDGDRERTRDAGFVRHLVKPVDLDELLQAIERATEPLARASVLAGRVTPRASRP